ncbi:MAG: ABC transporter ATP-binding protein, partial [Calditrichaeota bacterium]|nr:ABC transporter ATP-binding protein [Calditrichota bacterium]
MADYLKRYLGKYKWWYIIGAAMIVAKTYMASLGPEYVRRAVDYLKADFDQSVLLQYVLLIVLFSLGTGIFLYAMRRITIGASRLIENDIRNDFFAKLQSLDMNFFHHNRIGDLMARSTNDLNNIRSVFGPAVMYSVNLLLSFLVYPYMMFKISPELTFWALVPIPVMAFVVYTFGQQIYKMQQEIQAQYSIIS